MCSCTWVRGESAREREGRERGRRGDKEERETERERVVN